ncbi:MAG: S9 family peptidase [Arenimonas sp.]|nr:S9 family peptidase [Arenimonas sp.]
MRSQWIHKLLALCACLVACTPYQLFAVGFTPEDVLRLQTVSDPVFHPDGQSLVYSVGEVDKNKDEEVTDLWRVALNGGAALRLTKTSNNEWQPRFSADGQYLYFLSDAGKDEITQVWQMPIGGGSAKAITTFMQGVEDFAVSPDGQSLAVIVRDAAIDANQPKPVHPKPLVTTRFQFKEDITGYLDDRRLHLYFVNIGTAQAVQLTHGDFDDYLPAFSPDSQQIAFVSKRGEDPDRHLNWDIYRISAKAGAIEKAVTTFKGSDLDPYWETRPAWSPDGKKIAYARSGESQWIYYAPWQLAIVDVESGKEWQPALLDQFVIKPSWSADGRSVFALLESPQAMRAVKVDIESGKVTTLTDGARFDYGLAVNQFDQVVVNSSSPDKPFELQRVLRQGKTQPLTQHNAFLNQIELAKTEVIQFTGKDGTALQGLIVKPLNYQKGKRYPTLVRLHGGPVYQFSQEFMYDWQAYANAGFLVLAVNPRGSSGRGFEFAKAIYADWGNKDVQDILTGVDYAVELGMADPQRLGIGGWSYGSILTNYVIASDTRFKAAISGAGVSNSFAAYGFDQYAREYELELGTPWANKEVYERVSYPFLHADRITTPTLFQCSELDYNVPCQGAMQMYQALRSLNVPTQLVVYPDQNHGITVPSYLQDRLSRNLNWYQHYLMPESNP